jgi:hypothetical protein
MMTYEQWKDGTERGFFTPRSATLKEIDKAFEKWQKNKSTPNLLDFSKSVKTWLTLKGDKWRSSTRNSNGTVEKLVTDLANDPVVGRDFAPLLQAKPKELTPGVGKIIGQKDLDGNWHQVYFQGEESSCGPACIRIIVRMIHGRDLGEDGLKALVELAEEGEAGYAGSLGKGGVVEASGAHDWGPAGHGTWLVPEALRCVDPPIKAKHTTLPNTLLTTTRKQPAIAVVSWSNGGKHYVVVAGPLQKVPNAYLVIDPYYGVQKVDVPGGRLGLYKPVDQLGQVKATGTWDPWVCKVV